MIIGITGGIGSGKSVASDILEQKFDAYLINMDSVAHKLMSNGNLSYELIVNFFGTEILQDNKEIDRKKLAKIVYEDKEKLSLLNSFTHPYVLGCVADLIQENKSKYSIIAIETALPVEGKLASFCDEIWYVHTPVEIRKDRLIKKRGYTADKVDHILAKQISEEAYESLSSHVIINDEGTDKVFSQIQVLIEKLGDFQWKT